MKCIECKNNNRCINNKEKTCNRFEFDFERVQIKILFKTSRKKNKKIKNKELQQVSMFD